MEALAEWGTCQKGGAPSLQILFPTPGAKEPLSAKNHLIPDSSSPSMSCFCGEKPSLSQGPSQEPGSACWWQKGHLSSHRGPWGNSSFVHSGAGSSSHAEALPPAPALNSGWPLPQSLPSASSLLLLLSVFIVKGKKEFKQHRRQWTEKERPLPYSALFPLPRGNHVLFLAGLFQNLPKL